MASSGATFLPEDVVIQILLRLPVKSLLRFKCVCKYWYTLIKSPSFISQHYHHHNNRIQLLIHHCIPYIEESAFALFPDEMLVVRQRLDYLHMPTYLTNFVGPVNGLFLLHKDWRSHGSHLALWNPATREFRTLPGLDSNLPQWFMAEENYFGFGLDPLANDYKVIWIRYFWNEKLRVVYDPPVIGVYTLGTDSWRLLDPDSALMPPRLNSISSIYMNGTQYWLSYYEPFDSSIVAFDMGNEVFRVIQVPSEFTWGCLSLYNDSIALTSGKTVESVASVDIWVMEQEGCWTKHFRIGSLPKFSRPLGFWNNNELFLEDQHSDLVMYNLNSHEIRNIGVRGFEYGLKVFKYKESLVSVDVGKKNLEPHSLSDILQDFCKYKGPNCDRNIRPACGFCSRASFFFFLSTCSRALG